MSSLTFLYFYVYCKVRYDTVLRGGMGWGWWDVYFGVDWLGFEDSGKRGEGVSKIVCNRKK